MKLERRRKRIWWVDRNHGNYGRTRLSSGLQFRMEAGEGQEERPRTRGRAAVGRRNEKTDLVPRGGSVERCEAHYVEH